LKLQFQAYVAFSYLLQNNTMLMS